MPSPKRQYEAVIGIRWWLKWYLFGVLQMCRITGLQPDPAKVQYWSKRAVYVKVIRAK